MKKTFKTTAYFILNWAWQLPQNLLGLILAECLKAGKKETGGIVWYQFGRKGRFSRAISGVSLGAFILLPDEDLITIRHEQGHCKQSLIFGPLYLLIIGVYSAVFCNMRDRLFHKKWIGYDRVYWYYKTRWTESWADKLGGVDRDLWLSKIQRPNSAKYPAVEAPGMGMG